MTVRALLLLAFLSGSLGAFEPTRLLVENQPGLPPAAGRLAGGPHPWVESEMDLFGVDEPGPPIRVLLAPEASRLARDVPSWVSGYTDGVSNVVVLLPQRTPSYPDGGLEEVLAHEVAHVLIYRASAGRRIPRWFNEGLAMLAGRSWRLRDQTQLALGLLSGEKVPLWKLDDLFEGDRWQIERAYALSGALVQDLLDRYGQGLPRALLSRVARGLTFDQALREATGSTLLDVGESFYARQTVWRRWLPVFTSSAALWFGISLLALVAALKRRRQRRAGLRSQPMRVLLISSNTERINMVTIPLGLGLVAAATRRAGHVVTFLDLLAEADPVAAVHRAVGEFAPNVIGISVRNIDDQAREAPRFLLSQVRPVVEACRSCTDAPVVLGGAGFSIFPAAALRYLGADFGVAGDGEAVFPALLERLQAGRDPSGLPGVHVAGRTEAREPTFSEELGTLPQWDDALRTVADPAREDLWIPVQSRRGCPNDCSYCSTARIQGRRIRMRPAREVARHVAALAAAGFRRIYFVDNSFNIPETQAREICRELRGLQPHIEWRCILYPHLVREELVRAMAEGGCVEVSLGFESGSLAVLREMNKRFTPADVREISNLLAAHGIRRMGFLLLGGPGETRETVEESLAFAASLNLEALRITVGIRIYPGTPLARRALEEGVISANDDLLFPRFYLAPGLEPWIHGRVAAQAGTGQEAVRKP